MLVASCVSKRVTLVIQVGELKDNTFSVSNERRPEPEIILDNDQKIQNCQKVSLVSIQAVKEYLALIWEQYQAANDILKSQLLDEIVKNTGLHRKSIIRLINKKQKPTFQRGKGKSVNSYSDIARKLLELLWVAMGRMGAVRMKAAISLWIKSWSHEDMDDYVKFELKSMSSSTIERILKSIKANYRRTTNTGTKPAASKAKVAIPIRDLETQPTELGHCEIDCVAHCGGFLSGNHAWTLTLTDIASGITVNRAMEAKNGLEVEKSLYDIEEDLPFKIVALYMDNGSEFINGNIVNRFSKRIHGIDRQELIEIFRSRPY